MTLGCSRLPIDAEIKGAGAVECEPVEGEGESDDNGKSEGESEGEGEAAREGARASTNDLATKAELLARSGRTYFAKRLLTGPNFIVKKPNRGTEVAWFPNTTCSRFAQPSSSIAVAQSSTPDN